MKKNDTKIQILEAAVKLFAQKGYDAVGVSDIADAVGIKAPSLYKHYKNKRDIFDSILKRVSEMDSEKAKDHQMPDERIAVTAEKYKNISLETIREYAKAMLLHWTSETFSGCFRKMLTLEQYQSEEMADLYQNYLASGPVRYMADIFADVTRDAEEAYSLALAFYGPMYLLYGIYDAKGDIDEVIGLLDAHIDRFAVVFNARKEGDK